MRIFTFVTFLFFSPLTFASESVGALCSSQKVHVPVCEECAVLSQTMEDIQVHEDCQYWSRLGEGFAAYVGEQIMSCLCGIGDSGWQAVSGVIEMVRHPILTYRAMKEFLSAPLENAREVMQEVRSNVAGFNHMSEEQQAAYMCSSLIQATLAGHGIKNGVQRALARARERGNRSNLNPEPLVRVDIGSAPRSALSRNLPGVSSRAFQRGGRYYIEQTVGGRTRQVMISEEMALQIQNRGTITVYRATHYAEELSDIESGNSLSTWAQRHGGKTVEEVHAEIRNLHSDQSALSQRIREHGGHTNESPFISTTANRTEAINNFGRHPDAKIMKFEIPVDEALVGNQSEWEILFQGPIPHQYFKGFE